MTEREFSLPSERFSRMSEPFRRMVRLHEAAHAVLHTVIAKSSCSEIQVGGPEEYEQGYTFSHFDPNDPPLPLARAVAALVGPVANVVFNEPTSSEERKWLWRGSAGDFVTAIAHVGDTPARFQAWDLAVELVESLRSAIEATADNLEGRCHMIGDEVEAIVGAHSPRSMPGDAALQLLKAEVVERWRAGEERQAPASESK